MDCACRVCITCRVIRVVTWRILLWTMYVMMKTSMIQKTSSLTILRWMHGTMKLVLCLNRHVNFRKILLKYVLEMPSPSQPTTSIIQQEHLLRMRTLHWTEIALKCGKPTTMDEEKQIIARK